MNEECVHELGHTFGLRHRGSPGCAMNRSARLFDVDAKRAALCGECREAAGSGLSGSEP